ncbi:carboxylesterase family protein [Geobacillus zalihae]|uniref:carboxylesterase family protein n=1 Tax=Geobacillus zalihae TaxID=213419 RepID=UPI001CC20D5D|nr:carboxylesterase family protein [Geobacillus zalihae]
MEEAFELSFGALWFEISADVLQDRSLSRDLYNDMMTFEMFTYPSIYLSECQVRHDAPVWMYRFDYPSPMLDGHMRAYHALEIPYVWNTISKEEVVRITGDAPERFALANAMHRAWIAFAYNGDPNIPELPKWPQYDLTRRATMIFNTQSEVVDDPNRGWRMTWTKAVQRLRKD